MVKEGIINTVSVGFLPLERDGNTFTKQELLEISFVNVPANPEAIGLAYSKGISDSTMKEVFDINRDEEKTEEEETIEEVKEEAEEVQTSQEEEKKCSCNCASEKGRTDASVAEVKEIRDNARIAYKAMELVLKTIKEAKDGKN